MERAARSPAPKAPVTCADPDDQIFIDLAVRHRCALLPWDALLAALETPESEA